MKIQLLIGLLILGSCWEAAAKTVYADIKSTQLSPSIETSIWQKKGNSTPKYPLALAKRKLAGCTVFKVMIDADGKTDDIELIASIPSKKLAKHAKQLIKSWQWSPADTQHLGREEKLMRIDFCLGGADLADAQMRCEAQAKLDCE
ncbi:MULTISPECIES: energy transducer TonB [Pseudoalteromonas]|uniref:energy transducer TonB n=1 Tax=Pseudoalteromonas TaxID=53246 RepID=UPI0005FA58D3|nr:MULTISPECIES: energy transducer TonB [Pseudoalteromonas]KJY93806.1 hypothetical protein TW73_19030 [Pseudoalteromonas piscicida]ODB34659.1 hypothetical protein BB427_19065 [Pseudoalteromonas sp. BMB]